MKPSSARYKCDIRDMGEASDKLMKLRPVSFRYKGEPDGARQYGLIAEEVARVYPELVIRDAVRQPETICCPRCCSTKCRSKPASLGRRAAVLAQKDARLAALEHEVAALKRKDAKIDALAGRIDALEQQANASRPDCLAVR
jgi:hypothetical protein